MLDQSRRGRTALRRQRKRPILDDAPGSTSLQRFLVDHAERMKVESDQRIVLTCGAAAQFFVGLHEQLSRAAGSGAAINFMNDVAAGKLPTMPDRDETVGSVLYAYEFLIACAALTLLEVVKVTGGDVDNYPIDALVAAFKAKRWNEIEVTSCEIAN